MTTEQDLLQENLNVIKGTQQTSTFTSVDRLKVAVCGEPKSGKSYLIANTCRKPLLHYDFDDRYDSIAGCKDVTVKTLIDKTDTDVNAWNKLDSDIGTLEYLKAQNKLAFKSICFDSITFLRQYAEHQCYKENGGASKKFKIGGTDYVITKDWDIVTGVQKMLQSLFRRSFALGIDVYTVFHTRPEKDNVRSTKTEAVYKENLIIDPPNLKMLLPIFNDQWRCFTEAGNYKLQLKPDYYFNASTVLKNVNAVEESPNIESLLKKHFSK